MAKVIKHPNQGRVVRNILRPDPTTVEILSKCPTASIADCTGKQGVMEHTIKALCIGMKLCGPAITCLGPDLNIRRMAIDIARPGDILVIAVNGLETRACFGAYTADNMKRKSIAGIVIDGATRDSEQIREMGFPTFVKHVTPRNFNYPIEPDLGGVNVEVNCGGVIVRPGDIIVGDDDGVIVVPKEIAKELGPVVLKALKVEEEKWRGRIDNPYHVEEILLKRGYIFE